MSELPDSGAAERGRPEVLRAAVAGPPASTPLGRAAQVSVQLLLVAGAVVLVGYVVLALRLVVLPVLLALFLAAVLMPLCDLLRRLRFPPALAAFVTIVVAGAVIGGLIALLAPEVADELGDVGDSIREGISEITSWLESIGISQSQIDGAIDNALETLRANAGGIGQSVVTGATVVIEVVAGLLLMIVVLFFLLKDGRGIWAFFVGLLPGRRHADADEIGRRGWTTLTAYLRGITLVALFDAVVIGVALAILGVPLILPLAVLTFFGAFFPLIGAVTAGFVAVLVALVSNGVATALIVLAVIVAVQQLEGDVVYPLVVGRSIRLHALAILLAVTAGAVVAGVVGAFFAVPAVAVAWTAIDYFRGGRPPRESLPDPPGPDAVPEPRSA